MNETYAEARHHFTLTAIASVRVPNTKGKLTIFLATNKPLSHINTAVPFGVKIYVPKIV